MTSSSSAAALTSLVIRTSCSGTSGSWSTSSSSSFYRAESHVIVMGKQSRRVRIRLQQVLSDCETFITCEVRCLLSHTGYPRRLIKGDLEALTTSLSRGCPDNALKFEHLTGSTHQFEQVFTSHGAAKHVV